MTRDPRRGGRRRARAARTLSACSRCRRSARVRSLGPARLDALIALAFLIEGLLEAALLYRDAQYVWIGVLATASIAAGLACAAARPVASVALAVLAS